MNSFAGIFWLVSAQLQNRSFVEHPPVAAYVRCLKEKEWKKWNSVFLSYSVWHSSLWHCKVESGKFKNKLRTFQTQKWKQIKNSQPQTKFAGSYKKKGVKSRAHSFATDSGFIGLYHDIYSRQTSVQRT